MSPFLSSYGAQRGSQARRRFAGISSNIWPSAAGSVLGTTDTQSSNLCSHIIKRFDTNAVSASSLFRAAFPTATEDEEAVEMRWIVVGSRGQYGDTAAAGMEHIESKKLSGTWCVGALPVQDCIPPGSEADREPMIALQDPGQTRTRARHRIWHHSLRKGPDRLCRTVLFQRPRYAAGASSSRFGARGV